MISERYIKAGIITGIVLTSLTFVVSVTPFLMNIAPQIGWAIVSNDQIKEKFKQTDEYKAFAKRFPNYQEKYLRDSGSANLQLIAEDEKKENRLILSISVDSYRGFDMINAYANCDALHIKSGNRYSADNLSSKSFIESTNCLG